MTIFNFITYTALLFLVLYIISLFIPHRQFLKSPLVKFIAISLFIIFILHFGFGIDFPFFDKPYPNDDTFRNFAG